MKNKIAILTAGVGFALSGCTNEHTSCVARGTRVSTPDGDKRIEDLQIGDRVYCVDTATGELIATTVTFVKQATREVGSVTIAGRTTRMTSDHPVFDPTTGEYHPAGDWFTGSRTALLQTSSMEHVTPDSVSMHDGIADVFDITVESEHHNFIADGILVHNKTDTRCLLPDGSNAHWGQPCELEGCNVASYHCNVVATCVCEPGQMQDTGSDVSTADIGADASTDAADASNDTDAADMSADAADFGPDTDLGTDIGMD